ncbi:LysR substrate-binding domain-containing protein [Amorphus sp. 3PC139-8]|uniref:LysR substrate-binding domain-containing protein n=1 Tax=Amorphus sp. 3PC139-8 TaxID=2735676 RepID=UPI00345DA0DF
MTKRRLPPLKALLALESAVRTGSISAAAEDLSVTHGAVSKQITQLEQWLERPLFAEKRRGMIANAAGERLATAMGEARQLLAAALDDIEAAEQESELAVVAPATFAMRWLIPRLPSFQASGPGVRVAVRPTHTTEDWDAIPFDVMIRRGPALAARFDPQPLFVEELGLLTAPALSGASSPSALPLVAADTRAGELKRWFARATGAPTAPEAIRFPHFYIALEAALSGIGALVAPLFLVEELVRAGHLIEPWPEIRVPGATYTVGVNPEGNAAAARKVATWLCETAADCRSTAIADSARPGADQPGEKASAPPRG